MLFYLILGTARRLQRNIMKLKKHDTLQTPEWVYQPLGLFDLDPCAGEKTNIATVNWWDGRGENGLEMEWNGFVWCNPPFSQKELWAAKMAKHGNGIMVLPERGSAPWFGSLAKHLRYHFIMGKKIDFIGGPSSNSLGSTLFLCGDEAIDRIEKSGLPGHLNETKWFKPRCG